MKKQTGKIKNFLDKKLREIYEETKFFDPSLDLSHIKTEKGFEYAKGWNWYDFFNSDGCMFRFYFKDEKHKEIVMEIDGIKSSCYYGTVGMLYHCMDEIDEIVIEFRQFKKDLAKQEKINEIAKNCIKTWLKPIMQNIPYSYNTTENDDKITLSVKLNNCVRLDIPIYFESFQKIIPELPKYISNHYLFKKVIVQ